MSIALYLNPEAYDTSGAQLMGRHSAGEGFLKGLLKHGTAQHLYFWNIAGAPQDKLDALLGRFDLGGREVTWIPRENRRALEAPGCVHLPSPHIAREAWLRRMTGSEYAVTGITHTTATEAVMDGLAALMTAPVEPFDALICTSEAVRAAVRTQISAVEAYLEERLGVQRPNRPRLELIPLGLETEAFARDPRQRARWREALAIPPDAVVALYVGRFSLRTKMNTAAMAMALERAQARTGKTIVWVLSGWSGGESADAEFRRVTEAYCPSVGCRFVDGRQPDVRFSIWSVGDLFISLSDNVQETFGLTPVEAMAAGLPAVISDWNGYRDTVRDGVDGFRIRTMMPSAGLGGDLAYRFANDWEGYGAFIGVTSQFTAIDVGAATDAVAALVADPDLRARMGESAQARARGEFDWRSIIPMYEDLWAELNAARRVDAKPAASRPRDNPWRMDPFHLFQSYPTESLEESSLVAWAPGVNRAVAVGVIDGQPHVKVGLAYLPNREELERVFELLSMNPQLRLKDLLDRVPGRRGHVERGLVWLAKYGLLEITAPRAPA